MRYYPAFLDLQGKKILIVGGGSVAERKIDALLESGGTVFVIARDLTSRLEQYVREGRIRFVAEQFREEDLQDAWIVIAATDDPELNSRVSRYARARGILVNAVDQPSDCTFIVPSVVRRGDLILAVSTSGRSPALARRVREQLEQTFGEEYGVFLLLMGNLREEILSRERSPERRSGIFRDLVRSDLLKCIRTGDWEGAAAEVNRIAGTRLSAKDLKRSLEIT